MGRGRQWKVTVIQDIDELLRTIFGNAETQKDRQRALDCFMAVPPGSALSHLARDEIRARGYHVERAYSQQAWDRLLSQVGYGDPAARPRLWFLGMEESLGKDTADQSLRW
jgi:hypothetical protein